MQLALGMRVITTDDHDIGTIDRLVVDPQQNRIRAAVIRKGSFLGRDVEVALTQLEALPSGEVRILASADQVERLPDFVEANYMAPPADYRAPLGYPSTALFLPAGGGMLMPPVAGAAVPITADLAGVETAAVNDEVQSTPRQPEVDATLIGEGSEVYSKDGKKVGHVKQVVLDPVSKRLSWIVVQHGFLFTKEEEVPAALIDSIEDGTISLNVAADQVLA